MSYETPFAGLKVVDLSQGVAGPYCGMLLAQYGADVIKVEPVEGGDWARNLGVLYGDQCAYSIPANLGKRSIALDLKPDAGKQVLWRLIFAPAVVLVIVYLLFTYPATVLYVAASALAFAQDLRPAVQLI